MSSPYRAADAVALAASLAPSAGDALVHRIYTSRLLGADTALVLHGGGNTSVKAMAREADGSAVETLFVKGSGWDLATIDVGGFAACRLEPLRRLCALDALTDEAMAAALRAQMLDPSGPAPSVEALLHAFLPGRFVDHTHAEAVCTLVDQPDAAALALEVWGDAFVFIPYVMPGFALAKRVVELGGDLRGKHGLILEQHGIFTWGETAQESYERMIDAVARARVAADERSATQPHRQAAPARRDDRVELRRAIPPRLRGALARRGAGRFFVRWHDDASVTALMAHPAAREITARGTVTPDHVIRTKPRPMWLDLPPRAAPADTTDGAALDAAIESALARFADEYDAYVARGSAARGRDVHRLDSAPRIVLVPGVGALTLGRTATDTHVAGDILASAARVMLDADAIGRFTPVSELDLFDVEYWSLEQAKLTKAAPRGVLAGRIALVTGAASGIGRATAEHLLALGAHVMATDLASDALDRAATELAKRSAGRCIAWPLDVTEEASVRAAVETAVDRFGGLDIVVSNAGIAPQGLLHTAEGEARLARSLDVNLIGHQRVARAATEVMLAQRSGGCLLFNASKSALNPGPEFGPYAVAKAGLLALMRQYAVDLGAFGIRSNAVNADRVRTGLFGEGVLEARAKARSIAPGAYFAQNLLGRETTVDDVAAAFGWLAQAHATTGAVITVDGGNPAAFVR